MNAAQYAEKLSAVIGEGVKFINVPPEKTREGLLKSGMRPVLVDALMELMVATRWGKHDVVTAAPRAL
jgi:hypothetical protein